MQQVIKNANLPFPLKEKKYKMFLKTKVRKNYNTKSKMI